MFIVLLKDWQQPRLWRFVTSKVRSWKYHPYNHVSVCMQISMDVLSPCVRKLNITVPGPLVQSIFAKTVTKLQKDVSRHRHLSAWRLFA